MTFHTPDPYPYSPSSMPPGVAAGNGVAVAAFVLGLFGFLVTWIPFFVGLVLGFVPDVLGVVFGVMGIVRANRVHRGMGLAVTGLVLGGLAFLSVFVGAGTVW